MLENLIISLKKSFEKRHLLLKLQTQQQHIIAFYKCLTIVLYKLTNIAQEQLVVEFLDE